MACGIKASALQPAYTDLVYQPMLEVLSFFRANGYKTFIVTGGTIDFVRSFAERTYGVPLEQVLGTTFDATYAFDNGVAGVTSTNSPKSKRYPRLGAFVWHTDAVREYAYDRDTAVGRLDKGLTLAPQLGWQQIDMKRDWKVIFPYELR